MSHTAGHPDLFRDTWVRYLGYANEVGESLRPVISTKMVRYSYGVAFAYVLADTADKCWKSYQTKTGTAHKALVSAGDALLWQTFASIIIPGFTINRISAFTGKALAKSASKIPCKQRKIVTVAIALLAIPIIIHPIDKLVDVIMNETVRKTYNK